MARRSILFVNGSGSVEGDTRVLVNTMRLLAADPAFRCICATAPGPVRDELALIPALGVRILAGLKGRNAPRSQERSAVPRPILATASFIHAVASMARVIRAEKIELVYANDRTRAAEAAYLAARIARRPIVFHAHLPIQANQGRIRRSVMFRSDRVIAISRFVGEQFVAAGLDRRKLRVVLNAVPEVDRDAGDLRASLGLVADVPVVATVGRLSRFKGQAEVIRAAAALRARFPALQVLIAGRDTEEVPDVGLRTISALEALERLVADLGLTDVVRFLGLVSPASSVFHAADVVALPSYEEPFGLVVVEAMQMGRPVVACDSGGVPEIITDGETGVLVPPRDVDALAGALATLLDDRGLATRIGEAGRRHAIERFSIARYHHDIVEALQMS